METDKIAAIDLQSEYRRTLLAARFSSTVFILLAAGWYQLQPASITIITKFNG